jgi:hypothetical protein
MPAETIQSLNFEERLTAALRHEAIPFQITAAQYRRFLRVKTLNSLASTRYRARPYSGSVVLFKSSQSNDPDETYGWNKLATVRAVCSLPEPHALFLNEDNSQRIAKKLNELMAPKMASAAASEPLSA